MRIPQICPEKDGKLLWVSIVSHIYIKMFNVELAAHFQPGL